MPGGSYLEEYRRGRTPRPTAGDKQRLMADRDAYIAFLEVQLERVSAACMTAQGVSENVDRQSDAVRERVDRLQESMAEYMDRTTAALAATQGAGAGLEGRVAAAEQQHAAAEAAQAEVLRRLAALEADAAQAKRAAAEHAEDAAQRRAEAGELRDRLAAAERRADALAERVAELEARPAPAVDPEPRTPEPEPRSDDGDDLRALVDHISAEQQDARARLRAVEAAAAAAAAKADAAVLKSSAAPMPPPPPVHGLDDLAAQITELAEAVDGAADVEPRVAALEATGLTAAMQAHVEGVAQRAADCSEQVRAACVKLGEDSMARSEAHNRRVLEALDLVEQQVRVQAAEGPALAQRLEARVEQRLACVATQLETVSAACADRADRADATARALEQGQKALTSTVALKSAVAAASTGSGGDANELRAELMQQLRSMRSSLQGHVDARVADEGRRLALEHEQRLAAVASLDARVRTGTDRIDSFLDLYNDTQVAMLARLQESAAQTERLERMMHSASVDSALSGVFPAPASASGRRKEASSAATAETPPPQARPKSPARRRPMRALQLEAETPHAALHCAKEERRPRVPRQRARKARRVKR